MRAVWLFVLLLLSTSCASMSARERVHSFDESEYAPYSEKGAAVIAGQAFLRTAGGEVKYAAGEDVVLNPVTSYSTEWWEIWVNKGQQLSPPDERARAYNRSVVADGEGRFSFEGLPAGEYYVATSITWKVSSFSQSGGTVGARIKVSDGEHVNVILKPLKTF